MDGLLTNPPVGLNNRVHATGAGTLRLSLAGIGPADFAPDAGKLGDADLKEVRYQFSRWILPQIAHGELGSAMGLPAFIDPQLADCQDYFARVLLAPDFMVAEYRRQGNRFDLFADRFLIPDRVAFQRWMDPAFPNQFD